MPQHIPVPTLSSKGFVTDLPTKCDRLLAYFYNSNYSQTYLYLGNITSLSALIQRYGREPNHLCNNIRMQLERYLGRYFDQVQVDVSNNASISEGTTYSVNLSVQIIDGNQTYSLADQIITSDSVLEKIVKLVNGS